MPGLTIMKTTKNQTRFASLLPKILLGIVIVGFLLSFQTGAVIELTPVSERVVHATSIASFACACFVLLWTLPRHAGTRASAQRKAHPYIYTASSIVMSGLAATIVGFIATGLIATMARYAVPPNQFKSVRAVVLDATPIPFGILWLGCRWPVEASTEEGDLVQFCARWPIRIEPSSPALAPGDQVELTIRVNMLATLVDRVDLSGRK